MDPNSQPLDYKPSALAVERYSSKPIAGKELRLSSWCIASLYFYQFSTVIDISSENYSGSTGHGNGTSRKIFIDDDGDGTRTRNPSITNRVL